MTQGKLMYVPPDWKRWQKMQLVEKMEAEGYTYVGKLKSIKGEYWGFVLNQTKDPE